MVPIVTYFTLNSFVAYSYNFMACSTWISGMEVFGSRFNEITRSVWLTHVSKCAQRKEKKGKKELNAEIKKTHSDNYSNRSLKLDPGS